MGRRGRCRIGEGWRVSVTERAIVVRTRQPPLLTSLRPCPSRRDARQAHPEEQAAGAICDLGLWQNDVDRPPVHMQRGDRPTLTRAAGSVKAPPPEGTSSRGRCWCVGTSYGAHLHQRRTTCDSTAGTLRSTRGAHLDPLDYERRTAYQSVGPRGLASPPRSRPRQNAPSIVACGESSLTCRRV